MHVDLPVDFPLREHLQPFLTAIVLNIAHLRQHVQSLDLPTDPRELRAPAIFGGYLLLNTSLFLLIATSLFRAARRYLTTPIGGPVPLSLTTFPPTESSNGTGPNGTASTPPKSFADVAAEDKPTNGVRPELDMRSPHSGAPDVPLKELAQSLTYPSSLPRLVPVFCLLAALSLAATWFYMIRIFTSSYARWLENQDNITHLEPYVWRLHHYRIELIPQNWFGNVSRWLADSTLFKSAWLATVDTPHAWWWSQQIFFAAESWSLFLTVEGHRRGVRHLWAYMLLGQLVAVSFAVNLFFVAVLLHPVLPRDAARWRDVRTPKWLPLVYSSLYAAAPAAVYFLPGSVESGRFMKVLLGVHAALFVPVLVHPRREEAECGETRSYWSRVFAFLSLVALARHVAAWKEVVGFLGGNALGVRGLWWALWRDDAVTSVGLDVVMVGLAVGVWMWGRDQGNPVTGWISMGLGGVGLAASGFAREVERGNEILCTETVEVPEEKAVDGGVKELLDEVAEVVESGVLESGVEEGVVEEGGVAESGVLESGVLVREEDAKDIKLNGVVLEVEA